MFTINPKCVKLGELYGETDPNTFEWTDGLIATATRKFAKEHLQPTLGEESRPSSTMSALSGIMPVSIYSLYSSGGDQCGFRGQ